MDLILGCCAVATLNEAMVLRVIKGEYLTASCSTDVDYATTLTATQRIVYAYMYVRYRSSPFMQYVKDEHMLLMIGAGLILVGGVVVFFLPNI